LWGDAGEFERLGNFLQFSLPGGEKAVREPWRCAFSLVFEAAGMEEAEKFLNRARRDKGLTTENLLASLEAGIRTSSCGRLFDGISALLGYGDSVSFDGQAPMRLEAAARGSGTLHFGLLEKDNRIVLDWRPAVREILERHGRQSPARLSAAFHGGLAMALVESAEIVAGKMGTRQVALSGGVWQNRRLFSLTIGHLKRRGLEPVFHSLLSPNDECVSVGQAFVGHERWRS
jgi:hydrogenase maturation protein HypF